MKRSVLAVVMLFALAAVAVDVPFTANLQRYSAAPANSYVNLVLTDCGEGNIPVTAAGVKAVLQQPLAPNSGGVVTASITPNADITCGGVADGTRYRIEIKEKTGLRPDPDVDRTLAWGLYVVGPGPFVLNTATQSSSPAPSGTSIDFSAYRITRPFRRLAYASFPPSCAAGLDWVERTDPAVAGQVLYLCNAAGNGWDAVGGASGADPSAVKVTGDQAVGGVKTFTSAPLVPDPTLPQNPVTKAYMEANGVGADPSHNFWAASYGVKADTQFNLHASSTSGSATVTCSACTFVSGDVGKIVFGISDPMSGSVSLPQGTISAVVDAHTITASLTATATQAGNLVLFWGSDDSTALVNAWAASAGACGTLKLPAGAMLVQRAEFIALPNTKCASIAPPWVGAGVEGVNLNGTLIVPTPSFDFTTCTGGSGKTCFGGTPSTRYHDFTFWGGGNSLSGRNLNGAVFWELAQSVGLYQVDLEGWGVGSTNSTCLLDGSTQSGNYQGGVTHCAYNSFVVSSGAGTYGCGTSRDSYYGPGGNGVAIDIKSGGCLSSSGDNFDTVLVEAGGTFNVFASNTVNGGSVDVYGAAKLVALTGKGGGTLTVRSGGSASAIESFHGGYSVVVNSGGNFVDLGDNSHTLTCSGVCTTTHSWSVIQGTNASDTFNRADNATLGANWTAAPTGTRTAGPMKIVSARATGSTGAGSTVSADYYSAITLSADQKVSAVLAAMGTGSPSVTCRQSSSADTRYEWTVDPTHYYLVSVVAGTTTTLSTGAGSYSNGQTIELDCIGTTITGKVDGVTVASVTNSAISTGAPGVAAYQSSAGLINWTAQDSVSVVATITETAGAGAPTGPCVTGSTYRRGDGGTGTSLYVCESAAWTAANSGTLPTLSSQIIQLGSLTALAADATCSAGVYWLAPIAGTTNRWRKCTNGTASDLDTTGSGMADPGSNGIVKRTALNVTGTAAYADVIALFGAGSCSGYLKSDGTCDVPGGAGTVTHTAGALALNYPVVGNGTADVKAIAQLPWTSIDKTGATAADVGINFVGSEVPTGTVNGTNPTFTLAHTPASSSLELYINGFKLTGGSGYTLSTATITFQAGYIPNAGDTIEAVYRY